LLAVRAGIASRKRAKRHPKEGIPKKRAESNRCARTEQNTAWLRAHSKAYAEVTLGAVEEVEGVKDGLFENVGFFYAYVVPEFVVVFLRDVFGVFCVWYIVRR